jgi:hypothetical protein
MSFSAMPASASTASPVDAQLEPLCAAGCTKVYREKVTGASFSACLPPSPRRGGDDDANWRSRPQHLRSIRHCQAHRGREGAIRSLAKPWADTSTGRWMLAVLRGPADVERGLIRTRPAEGRSRAKAQGRRMSRLPARAAERGYSAPRGGRYVRRTRPQLQGGHIHHSPRDTRAA